MPSLYDFTLTSIDGDPLPLNEYKDKVVLIVNVASQCGLTPQYSALQNLFNTYANKGLIVLGIPCNQFASQEPGTEKEIKQFCETNYQVKFPLTAKIDVNGDKRDALYEWLAGADSLHPGEITWNFEKFLINKQGELVARFNPKIEPDDAEIITAINQLL